MTMQCIETLSIVKALDLHLNNYFGSLLCRRPRASLKLNMKQKFAFILPDYINDFHRWKCLCALMFLNAYFQKPSMWTTMIPPSHIILLCLHPNSHELEPLHEGIMSWHWIWMVLILSFHFFFKPLETWWEKFWME